VEIMNTETVLPWEQFAKAGAVVVESMTRLQQIGSRSVERMGQQQMAAAGDLLELGVRHLETLTSAQRPEDLWTAQTRLATQVGEKWMGHAGKFLDIYLEGQAEMSRLFTEQMSAMTPAASAKSPKAPAKAASA
jgi:phasin family protein